jgi:hypothetical protein
MERAQALREFGESLVSIRDLPHNIIGDDVEPIFRHVDSNVDGRFHAASPWPGLTDTGLRPRQLFGLLGSARGDLAEQRS